MYFKPGNIEGQLYNGAVTKSAMLKFLGVEEKTCDLLTGAFCSDEEKLHMEYFTGKPMEDLKNELKVLSKKSGETLKKDERTLVDGRLKAEPEQWKENLNRATMPLGQAEGRNKSWRITVTDRRGGRGTDYRVDDSDVDGGGGLLLIPAVVPTSQREWTQFLGRTARQDRRGQFCAVLCAKDYATLSSKYKEPMPQGGCGLEPVQMVLHWGDLETAERIKGSAALYNCGVRVNELCEEVFGKRQKLLRDPAARERLVDVCLEPQSKTALDECAGGR
eukprot:symbB.v1.2.009656.t1/scaffold593.1/size185935/7